MMVITASRKERRARTETLREFEPEYIPIKTQRALQIRHLQMHMADTNLRSDWLRGKTFFHGGKNSLSRAECEP